MPKEKFYSERYIEIHTNLRPIFVEIGVNGSLFFRFLISFLYI